MDYSGTIEEREQAIYDLMNEYSRDGRLVAINARELDNLKAELHFEYSDQAATKKVKVQLAHMYSDGVDETIKIKTPHKEIVNNISEQK
ncbi:hypothetical protein LG296_20130 (plasmid) [Ureibacillus chungkukjangi]|uniref:hypothetical protein n=1 Tax=Ureibacillus chungkukjangi TaxID=1202712 RepID=UPI0012901F1E|nr:hypothetical protein [Ureibacillus chungkukjangi]MCM3390688.1 hypothetical protein [Ureibacillus chungkukjangi]